MRRLLQNLATLLRIRPAARVPPQPTATEPSRGPGAGKAARTSAPPRRTPAPAPRTAPPSASSAGTATSGHVLVYAPQLDGRADPGEIVWTWVPYEEDPSQGKDRPVLVVGRTGTALQGLMLSSNSDRDGQRHWFALGPGSWDKERRPSWIRLDRVLQLDEDGIRREGAILDRRRFDAIAAQLRRNYGWH